MTAVPTLGLAKVCNKMIYEASPNKNLGVVFYNVKRAIILASCGCTLELMNEKD